MHRLACAHDATDCVERPWTLRTEKFCECRRDIESRNDVSCAALEPDQVAKLGIANAGRVRQHGLEHGLQLARRAADDLEHLRRRGLLLQRFAEIVGALAQLVEQPGVLDGDDGLGGEVLHQLDLLVGEGAHLLGGR